jgi:hypothetical protein
MVEDMHTNNIVQNDIKKLLNVHFTNGDFAKSLKLLKVACDGNHCGGICIVAF